MHFAVFSYNRGEFLENCVASIERCAPTCDVTVFDDDSDDEATRRVLDEIGARHDVVRPRATSNAGKHGGLYANMQAALERFDAEDEICLLQDDMQLVRELDTADFDGIARYFDEHDDAAFVQPAFLKGCNRDADTALTRFDPATGGYLVDRTERSAGAWYSDIHVMRPGVLRAAGWRYRNRESQNEQQARAHFRQMMYLRCPFAAWLPHAPAYRGKTRTWALRRGERLAACDLYPFRILSGEANRSFLERPPEVLPFAEDLLTLADNTELPQPWIYHPLQGRRLLKHLNSAELKLRRLF